MPEYNFTFDWNRITTIGKVKILAEQVVGNPSQEALNAAVAAYIEDHPGALSPLSAATKAALLQIAEKVAYIDEHGQDYYNALDAALNAIALLQITAVYTQSGTVYDTDSLDSLKADLVVTAYYDDSTTADVTAAAVLSGTLTEGTSTITATYEDKTATFDVTVSALSYVTSGLIHRWDGIQNTANGHDSSVTTWKDLIGSYDLEFKDTGGTALVWNADSLSFDGSSHAYVWAASGQSETANDKTIEIVCKPLTQGSSAATITQTFSPGSANADAVGKVSIFSDNTVSAQGKSGYTYATGLSSYTAINSIVATFASTPAVNKVYVNNTELSLSTITHSLKNTYNRMVVGASKQGDGDTGTGYWFTGKIYAIRIYNRNLTAEEIAQNYAVDVQRFNLV